MKLYSDITDTEIREIVATWDQASRLDRHTSLWLAEHDYNWDPDRTDDQNRAEFEKIAHRARKALAG